MTSTLTTACRRWNGGCYVMAMHATIASRTPHPADPYLCPPAEWHLSQTYSDSPCYESRRDEPVLEAGLLNELVRLHEAVVDRAFALEARGRADAADELNDIARQLREVLPPSPRQG